MQCGYDLPCQQGRCIVSRTIIAGIWVAFFQECQQSSCEQGVDDHRFAFCKANQSCLDLATVRWQEIYIGALKARYEELAKNYTGLNILGTVQQAGGVAGAAVGRPAMGQGSPCGLMAECVHPAYGKAGAAAVGEAFWALYFSKYPKPR